MAILTRLLESLVRPLLELLDLSGLFQTARFTPLYGFVAAVAAVVLVAYVTALVFAPLDKRVDGLRRIRGVGRLVSIGLAAYITYGIFANVGFILERGGGASGVVRSNLGFLLTLALVVFLEVRLMRRRHGR